MPELPEVETIKEDLRKKILNQKIIKVEVIKDKSVGFLTDSFVNVLENNEIFEISRRGKLMYFTFKKSQKITIKKEPVTTILVHLKMTGQLIYERRFSQVASSLQKRRSQKIPAFTGMTDEEGTVEVVAGGHKLTQKDFDLPNKHTQVIFSFEDGGKLFFNDLRRFGYMKIATDKELEKVLSGYGVEPLSKEYDYEKFEKAIGKRKVAIKVALMDQKKIAGIGNIYADESCFCAGILPTRSAATLTTKEAKKLYACIPTILKLAIEHRGTSFKDYLDSEGKKGKFIDFLKVYDREGEKCTRCGVFIKKIQSGGRGTHYCPGCQK